jgi:hypothetical protein
LLSPKLPVSHHRSILAFALAIACISLAVLPGRTLADPKAKGAPEAFDPMVILGDLRQRLATSYEYDARARLADLDRLVHTARNLRRSDGTPIEVRFEFKRLHDGIEADVVAVSPTAIEISLNEASRVNPTQVAVSFLHELVHVAQFAAASAGRLSGMISLMKRKPTPSPSGSRARRPWTARKTSGASSPPTAKGGTA